MGINFNGQRDLLNKASFLSLLNSKRNPEITLILGLTEDKARYIVKTCRTNSDEPIEFSPELIFNTPQSLLVCIIDPITGQKVSSYTKASILYFDETLVLKMQFLKEDFIPTWKEYKLRSNILIRTLGKNRIGITFLVKGQIATSPVKNLRKVSAKKSSGTSARWKGTTSTASLSYRPENHDGSKFSLDRYFG